MTKRHFEAFARMIKADMDRIATPATSPITQKQLTHATRYAAELFASIAIADNPRFDRDRFMLACGLKG